VGGQVRRIPFEVMVRGDKAPVYEETLEDLGRFNDQPALPFNAYGTMALARGEFEPNSGSSQVFWLLKARPPSSLLVSARMSRARRMGPAGLVAAHGAPVLSVHFPTSAPSRLFFHALRLVTMKVCTLQGRQRYYWQAACRRLLARFLRSCKILTFLVVSLWGSLS